MPRAVQRPAKGREVELIATHVDRRMSMQEIAHHFNVAVPGGEMQWRPAVLATDIDRPARFEHQANGLCPVVLRGPHHPLANVLGHGLDEIATPLQKFPDSRLVSELAKSDIGDVTEAISVSRA